MPSSIADLLQNFERFRAEHWGGDDPLMQELAREGQRPEVLVIACSDSRVDPAILTGSRPGDLFIVRNVAAIVPTYGPSEVPRGASAAIEFGVRGLEVRDIVVLGHAACGGMRLLAEQAAAGAAERRFEFVDQWVTLAQDALLAVDAAGLEAGERQHTLEMTGIVLSLRNLLSFPWIAQRVRAGQMALHGWYFDLHEGELMTFDAARQCFVPGRGVPHPITSRAADLDALDPLAFARGRAQGLTNAARRS